MSARALVVTYVLAVSGFGLLIGVALEPVKPRIPPAAPPRCEEYAGQRVSSSSYYPDTGRVICQYVKIK